MKVVINKYGPISNAVIQFAPMLIFTGDSNLGKSYVNYLMYYILNCASVSGLIRFFSSNGYGSKNDFDISIKDVQGWMRLSVTDFMRDFLNSPMLVCDVDFDLLPLNPEKIYHISYKKMKRPTMDGEIHSDLFPNDEISQVIIDGKSNSISLPNSSKMKTMAYAIAFSRHLQKDLFGKIISQCMILPPARGAFVGENYTLKDSISSSVGMYRQFLNDYDRVTNLLGIRSKNNNPYLLQIEKLVGGKLFSKDGVQYLIMKNGQQLPLSAAASSIKELSPLLYSLMSNRSTFLPLSYCIEEPEAHLHPQMQVATVDLLACCFSDGMLFQMTTHSDYVIQRINQLVKLDYVRQNNETLFKELCQKHDLTIRHCIDKEKVKVYYFSVADEGNVSVEELAWSKNGMPMKTFFDVVSEMNRVESDLNEAIYQIER